MKVLIDTNIIIDYLVKREPFFQNSKEIILKCCKKEIDGYVAAHSFMNAFYILRKGYSTEERRKMLLKLCQIIKVVGIDENKIKISLKNEDFKDIEDCLQTECAVECDAKYIITRNVKDFTASQITPILPENFLLL